MQNRKAFPHDSATGGEEAEFSPILHRFSTGHPEASVEIRPLILSANEFSDWIRFATFSHA